VDSNHHLFVVNYNAATVGKYDATTGATVVAQFVNDNQGLNLPQSAALDSLNNHLFVYDTVNGWVSEFDATTGATVKFHFANYGAPALLVDGHNHLFVANPAASTPSVMEFDATTGAIINANFISAISAFGLALDDNNHLFVSDNSLGTIGEYDATTGAPINANFITGLGTGLSGPWAVVFVKPVISGDINANGTVDSADYILWRKGLGTTYTQADYDVWRTHFGQTSGPGSGVSATVSVPEPATLMMLLTGAPAMCSRRRAKVS
jgi:hypothetical protein